MATSSGGDDVKPIMISYNWNSQERVKILHQKLEEEEYNVWIDYEKMEGSLLDSMADAIENADTIIMCVSTDYHGSKNCKLEAQNAHHLDKRIIPLIFEENYVAKGWLGTLVRPRLYFRFDTDEMLEENFEDLVKALGDSGRRPRKAPSTATFDRMKALQCTICSNRFRVPKALPCLHTFCKQCLLKKAPRGTKTITCPQCQQQADIPGEDAAKFPTNFHLTELIEEEAKKEQLSAAASGFTCNCCDAQASVAAKCDDCSHYLCADGTSAHKRFRVLRHHKVLAFEAPSEEAAEPAKDIKRNQAIKRKPTDWSIMDALFDVKHSTNLFGYWKKQHGDETWQEHMVTHYLDCLEKNKTFGEEGELIARTEKVAIVFMQTGKYDKALQLVEDILKKSDKALPDLKPEMLANLYYLAAEICREMMNARTHDVSRQTLIKQQMSYSRKALGIRRDLPQDDTDNKFELARVLRVLSGALRRSWKNDKNNANVQQEGLQLIEESIKIFHEINATGNVAESLYTKALLQDPGSDEQQRLFLQAIIVGKETFGEVSVPASSLYRSMCTLCEQKDNYNEAYDWLVKSSKIREKVYGKQHPRTLKVYEELNSDVYIRIRKERESIG